MDHHARILRTFWRNFLLLSLIPIIVLVLYTVSTVHGRIAEIILTEQVLVNLGSEAISQGLAQVAVDLCVLSRQNEVRDYINTGDAEYIPGIAREYHTLVENTRVYDQVRLLDETGMERIRVNYNAGEAHLVAPELLQDKSDRYYFIESMARQAGTIYVSPLDLNVEHDEIELPFKPMIRFGTPVFDDAGQPRGIILVNFLAQAMLDRVEALGSVSPGQPFMLNGDGYWLASPDPGQTWGFMLPDRSEDRMSVRFPAEWEEMQGTVWGHMRTGNGLFTYAQLFPLTAIGNCAGAEEEDREGFAEAGDYRWIVASHVPESQIEEIWQKATFRSLGIGLPVLVLLAVGTRAIGLVIGQRQRYQARLEAMARFDALTRLANRATLEDRLAREADRDRRYGRRFAVLYLDLDGFKDINDTLGHEAGDRVLQDVAGVLTSRCRSVDTPARFGGDEFVVLLTEIRDKQAAYDVATDILERIGGLTYGDLTVGVSIGIAVWPDDDREALHIVRIADAAMYVAKKSGKNRVQLAEG